MPLAMPVIRLRLSFGTFWVPSSARTHRRKLAGTHLRSADCEIVHVYPFLTECCIVYSQRRRRKSRVRGDSSVSETKEREPDLAQLQKARFLSLRSSGLCASSLIISAYVCHLMQAAELIQQLQAIGQEIRGNGELRGYGERVCSINWQYIEVTS